MCTLVSVRISVNKQRIRLSYLILDYLPKEFDLVIGMDVVSRFDWLHVEGGGSALRSGLMTSKKDELKLMM